MDSAQGMRSSGRERQRQSSKRSRSRRHGRAAVRALRLSSRKTVGSFPRSRAARSQSIHPSRAEMPAGFLPTLPFPGRRTERGVSSAGRGPAPSGTRELALLPCSWVCADASPGLLWRWFT